MTELNISNYKEKAVMYLRVSSKGQEDGFSLDAQEKLAKDYAERNNLDIVKSWKVQESAWGKHERINFTEMIDYIKRNKEVKHIIFDVIDRMTRNDNDKLRIYSLIKDYGKTIHFSRTNHKIDKNKLDSSQEFMVDVEVAASKKLSNDIAYKTRMGMNEKAEQGIYPANAPVGYLNITNDRNEAVIILDEKNATLIKELFEYASTDKYSVDSLAEIFYDKGLRSKFKKHKITAKSLYGILHNPFYYGYFIWGKKMYKGSHIPLVSKEVWDSVQEILKKKAHRFDTKHKYPFNRLITCEHCGHGVLGAKSKNRYLYYRCAAYNKEHSSGYLREEEILGKLSNVIKDIELPYDVRKIIIKGLKRRGIKANLINKNNKEVLEKEKASIEDKLSKLIDMRLENDISNEQYKLKNEQLNKKKENIEKQLALCEASPEIANKAIEGLKIINGLEKYYQKADNYGKANLLRLVGAKYILTKNNEIIVEYKEPFNAIYHAKKGNEQEMKKVQNLDRNSENAKIIDLTKKEKCPKNEHFLQKSCRKNYWGG